MNLTRHPLVIIAGVVIVLLVGAYGNPAHGQDSSERRSLRGVGAIDVLVEGLGSKETGIGLSESGLQALVELQLRRNGVPVGPNVQGYLYVNVTVAQDDVVAYMISLEFKQFVTVRTNGMVDILPSWDQSLVGLDSSGTRARERIRDTVRDYVDIFSNDYLAVNP